MSCKVETLPSTTAVCKQSNQVAFYARTYGVYPAEVIGLQRDYTELWARVSNVLEQLAAIVGK